MPATYNGIGTRYVGRQNVDTRVGACSSCRREGTLTSYDTRLWFVVFYIPVIPLARKRIIDDCSSCRRHYVMPLDQWEAGKQLSISGAMEEFRREPTPEKAIEAQRQLIAYHQGAQAEEFGQTMAGQFADNANVLLYLGGASEHLGRYERAADYFRRALELRPDLPGARMAVAEDHLRHGRLDEARGLLDFLEAPGAARVHSPVPLEMLANAYQKAGRHQDALNLYDILLREVPAAGQHPGFRKRVRASEKALKRPESALPKRKWSFGTLFGQEAGNLRWLTVGGVALLLVAVAMFIGGQYIRGHRKLYLVNGYDQPATVQVPGFAPVTVGAEDHAEIALPEGTYEAEVSGPVNERVECEVKDDFFGRFFRERAWVLNVGGRAVLITERAHYVKGGGRPSEINFQTGTRFARFPTVDRAFTPLPESMQLDRNSSEKTLTQLDMFRGAPVRLVERLVEGQRVPEALDIAEAQLLGGADDPRLLSTYEDTAETAGQGGRVRAFLHAGLSRRPVNISWHRAYQNGQRQTAGGTREMRGEYDAMLAAAPNDSALLYLRGRLCDQRAEAVSYNTRSVAADPANFWPHFALGYERSLSPNWDGARRELDEAHRLAGTPPRPEVEALLFLARCGQRDFDALEKDLRRQLTTAPTDIVTMLRLADVLASTDRKNDARKVLEDWATRARRLDRSNELTDTINAARQSVLYSLGDFNGIQMTPSTGSSTRAQLLTAEAELEQGKLDAMIQQLAEMPDGDQQAAFLLATSVAALQGGDTARGTEYREKAVAALRKLGSVGEIPAALLSKASAPSSTEVDEPDINIELKRLVLASLALQHRERAADFKRQAAALNVSRTFPFHLINKVAQTSGR